VKDVCTNNLTNIRQTIKIREYNNSRAAKKMAAMKASSSAAAAAATADPTVEKRKRNKKVKKNKKKRLPKDLTQPIDPERWLPLKERSYFKGRRGNRKAGARTLGAQGAATVSSAHLTAFVAMFVLG